MDASDTELVRKVLASVLKRLEGGGLTPAGGDVSVASKSSPAHPSSGPLSADNNLVVIVLGQAGVSGDSQLRETASIVDRATHPGFERFAVSQHCSSDSAPKTCFLEPDKVCVNSGACETRGY